MDHYWIRAVDPRYVTTLDVSDPGRPREVARLELEPKDDPHWLAREPYGRRIVITGGSPLQNGWAVRTSADRKRWRGREDHSRSSFERSCDGESGHPARSCVRAWGGVQHSVTRRNSALRLSNYVASPTGSVRRQVMLSRSDPRWLGSP